MHLHSLSHTSVWSCTEKEQRCISASQNCSQLVVIILVLGEVLLCFTAALVPVVMKDAADHAAVTVLTGTGRAVPERNRLSGRRDNFLGAENSHSLGGCRSHPGFPYSVNVLQAGEGFMQPLPACGCAPSPWRVAWGLSTWQHSSCTRGLKNIYAVVDEKYETKSGIT